MKLCTLVSGSTGNSTLIEGNGTKILVDVGMSAKRIEYSLESIGRSMKEIDAILLTHEHRDHIIGAEVLSRRYDLPVYTTKGTIEGMGRMMKPVEKKYISYIKEEVPFQVGSLEILPFRISHDALEPVGFFFRNGEETLATATDTGVMEEQILEKLKRSDLILLESNYDEDMLNNGPYPYPLKQRILSKWGHLSNHNAAETIKDILKTKGVPKIILGHISYNNNYPRLVLETIYKELSEEGIDPIKDLSLSIAGRYVPSDILEITKE